MRESSVITVLFTCHRCGLQRVRVNVPARGSQQHIMQWMVEVVSAKVGARHSFLSPDCPEWKYDLAVPLPSNESDGIGMSADPLGDDTGLWIPSEDVLKRKGAN